MSGDGVWGLKSTSMWPSRRPDPQTNPTPGMFLHPTTESLCRRLQILVQQESLCLIALFVVARWVRSRNPSRTEITEESIFR